MFLYCLRKELLTGLGATGDMLVVHVYDALGEKHGRSEEGFKWALDIEGAIDMTKELTLKEVSNLQGELFILHSQTTIQDRC
jgi:hypothetical protein